MSGRIAFVLTCALLACALSLVNSQYQRHYLVIELERAQAVARQLDIDWAQLQLDQSTLGKHARIEMVARRELKMMPPTRTEYVTPGVN